MNQPAVEKLIAAALADNDIVSTELAALITETETAIVQAETTAKTEHARALDPALSPDLSKARAAKEDAEFAAARLHTLLPRLQLRLREVEVVEYAAQWDARYKRVEVQRDAEAKRFAECRNLMTQLGDRFASAKAVDEEVHRVNAEAPTGEHRRLLGVELTARGLQEFSSSDPSVVERTQIPDYEHSAKMAWPPPRQFDPSLFAPMPYDRRYSDEWWKTSEEETRAAQAERERIAAHFAAMTRQQAEREAAEAQKRGGGPRN